MREFVANFQKKHGQQVPMPKIYGDEDSSDSEGLELADRTRVGKKATGSACGGDGTSTSGRSRGRTKGKKQGWDADGDEDDPNKHRKTEGENALPKTNGGPQRATQEGHSLPPDRQKATSTLHLPHKREDLAGPLCIGLD